ncbi:RNA polymerase subunit sigma-70 [Saccharibacillus sp. O23]|uniref:sigma-70 family RNA polymerase sigma factor n=1 Tax=Saccharibacillus sp. O23 TaxID=2009338 RepID=UPI000B4E03DF|nr:sigma-70 family RNA polymerase sigma factor [Saccharibacillus sp. O23]OWR28488.1 RNA polymerase subunit sigma-70 [Saccharibacillus sp. O23]
MENEQEKRERAIVRRLRKKDERALRELIDLHGGLLAVIVNRYLPGSPQDREECLDDVLLAIWDHIESFDAKRNTFRQWCAAVAKYRAIDYARRAMKERERRSSEALDAERLPSSETGFAPRGIEADEVLARLPESERRLFEQHYLEGVPVRELAEERRVRESWVHNKLSRGRRKLKKIWTARKEVHGE